MHARPQLRTVTCGPQIERSVGAVIFLLIHRFPQIVRTMSIFRPVMLLGIVACACQVVIEQSGNKFVYSDRSNGRHADINLATWIMGSVNDHFSCDLRLVNWRHRLRLAREPASYPAELRP